MKVDLASPTGTLAFTTRCLVKFTPAGSVQITGFLGTTSEVSIPGFFALLKTIF